MVARSGSYPGPGAWKSSSSWARAGVAAAAVTVVFPSYVYHHKKLKEIVVLGEMLRVGTKGIVGFPNFAYWRLRLYLLFRGRMPKTEFLPYEWYDTPNIHFCSIEDFDAYCDRFGLRVERRIYLSNDRGGRVLRGVRPNLFAESAVYLLAKR